MESHILDTGCTFSMVEYSTDKIWQDIEDSRKFKRLKYVEIREKVRGNELGRCPNGRARE